MRVLYAFMMLGLMSTTGVVSAAETPPNANKQAEKAEELFNTGREAFKAGEFEKARALFRDAMIAEPRRQYASLLCWNMARTYEELDQYQEAIEQLASCERLDLKPEEKKAHKVHRIRLQERFNSLAIVTIEGQPKDCSLLVNGRERELDEIGRVKLKAGKHSLSWHMKGQADPFPQTEELNLKAKQEVTVKYPFGYKKGEAFVNDKTIPELIRASIKTTPEDFDANSVEMSVQSRRTWGLTGTFGGGAALAGGVLMFVLAKGKAEDYRDGEDGADSTARGLLYGGDAAMVIGTTAIGIGVWLLTSTPSNNGSGGTSVATF